MAGFLTLAKRLIETKGKNLLLQKPKDGAYDPTTGTSSGWEEPVALIGVVSSYRPYLIDGATVKKGDHEILFAGDVDIEVGDRVYFGTNKYEDKIQVAISIEETYDEDVIAMYTVQTR